jgi:hypothetical protein
VSGCPALLTETRRHRASLEHLNEVTAWWLGYVADVRVHRETGQRPIDRHAEERPHLIALSATPYDVATVEYRVVNVEGCVVYRQNSYSVPWRYIGQARPVRVTETEVIVYSPQLEEVARHHLVPRGQTGQRCVQPGHRPSPDPRQHEGMLRDRFAELGPVAARFLDGQPFGRKPVNGADSRLHVPRKRTRFPGQHACCWYCGRRYVWGGNGVTDNLMCAGSREWTCWNSIGFNGALSARRLVEVIMPELYRLDGFDDQFRELVQQATRDNVHLGQRWEKLRRDEEAHGQEKEHILAAAGNSSFPPSWATRPMFEQKLAELDATERALARERQELKQLSHRTLKLPESVTWLRQMLKAKFQELATDSPEFGELMRQLVPEFRVYLVRLCDGGHLLPRAKVKLALGSMIPDAGSVPGLDNFLLKELTLDLFEPPQRERIREAAVRLAAQGLEQRQIAQRLPEKATQPAVQRALAPCHQRRCCTASCSGLPRRLSSLRRCRRPSPRALPSSPKRGECDGFLDKGWGLQRA